MATELQHVSIFLCLFSEALDAQKEMYEKQLSELRDQLQESAVTKQSLPSTPNTLVLTSHSKQNTGFKGFLCHTIIALATKLNLRFL